MSYVVHVRTQVDQLIHFGAKVEVEALLRWDDSIRATCAKVRQCDEDTASSRHTLCSIEYDGPYTSVHPIIRLTHTCCCQLEGPPGGSLLSLQQSL